MALIAWERLRTVNLLLYGSNLFISSFINSSILGNISDCWFPLGTFINDLVLAIQIHVSVS